MNPLPDQLAQAIAAFITGSAATGCGVLFAQLASHVTDSPSLQFVIVSLLMALTVHVQYEFAKAKKS